MRKFTYLSFALLSVGCSHLDITEQKTVQLQTSDIELTDKVSTVEIASMPAQLRNAYVWTKNDGERIVCPEPFPDVAASTSLNATANAVNKLNNTLSRKLELEYSRQLARARNRNSGENNSSDNSNESNNSTSYNNVYDTTSDLEQSLNLGLQTTSTMVNLGGRTDIVLLAREMVFANCVAAANNQLVADGNSTTAQENLSKIFTILEDMVKADRLKAETKKEEAEAKKEEAQANKISVLISGVKQIDPKILASVTPNLIKIQLKAATDDRDKCRTKANGDAKKEKLCDDKFTEKIAAIYGK